MKMLREWNGESHEPIIKILDSFDVKAKDFTLLKYEALTPDSFIWVIVVNGERYCLYAEDFVQSLKHIREAMHEHGFIEGETDKYELVPVKSPQDWNEASPVKAASTYEEPEDKEDFVQYAATSGFDFVFLGKSTLD